MSERDLPTEIPDLNPYVMRYIDPDGVLQGIAPIHKPGVSFGRRPDAGGLVLDERDTCLSRRGGVIANSGGSWLVHNLSRCAIEVVDRYRTGPARVVQPSEALPVYQGSMLLIPGKDGRTHRIEVFPPPPEPPPPPPASGQEPAEPDRTDPTASDSNPPDLSWLRQDLRDRAPEAFTLFVAIAAGALWPTRYAHAPSNDAMIADRIGLPHLAKNALEARVSRLRKRIRSEVWTHHRSPVDAEGKPDFARALEMVSLSEEALRERDQLAQWAVHFGVLRLEDLAVLPGHDDPHRPPKPRF